MFCHACGKYTDDAVERAETVDPPATPAKPAVTAPGPAARAGRQVLVLPIISQNRMWGVRAIVTSKEKLYLAVKANDWHGIMKAIRGIMHVTHDGEKYKEEAAAWLAAQKAWLMDGELRVQLTLYLQRRVGDTDNYTKALSDVLQGSVVENDKQFSEWHIVRRYDKEYPRAVVVLEPDDGSTVLDPGATFRYEQEF